MKIPLTVLALVCGLPAALWSAPPEFLWETKGLSAPESIVYDAARHQYYVSNMGTFGAGEKPDDGFIARLGEDGKIVDAHWIGGLKNPKGLALAKGHLFAGDDVYLWEIDIAAGKIVGRHKPAEGDGDFNDSTADAEGDVYVCSGKLATVYRWHEGKFEPWVKLDYSVTGGINGLHAEKGRLILGGWSLGRADGTEEVGHLSTVDYRTHAIGRFGTKPICHIDGLEPDGKDGYVVSDWLTGEVFHVTPDGAAEKILTLHQGTADMLYRKELKLLLIPMMNDNSVRAYRWAP